ncbi:hypothetical protein GCM10009777_11290 [Microbacterium pumilum]|uniref:CAAX prenyl protease 2/Lysostaphin resistance protein A-like domain-containing protein n=2 Tax=Microbacterium pumilum TaxID=344165 RepID=A0ABN2S3V9_9MICO
MLFGAIAVASGWLLLSVPPLLGLPLEPFILATLGLGLVVPALVFSHRTPGMGARALLRGIVRLPHPTWILIPSVLGIPVAVWSVASFVGVAMPIDPRRLLGLAIELLMSLIVVNIWEEMAWTGYFQGSAMAVRGVVMGSIVTALLFAAVHLPLALFGIATWGDGALQLLILVSSAIGLRLAIGVLYTAAGGSILAVAMVHASFNTAGGLVTPGNDGIRIGVVITIGVVAAIIYVARRHRAHTPGRAR